MAPLVWVPGGPVPGLPAPLPEPQAPVGAPGVMGTVTPGGVVGATHLPLVAEIGAFRSQLRHYLRSNSGRQSKLNPGRIPSKGPVGQSTMGSNGLMGDPHVQTVGKRAGAIVQSVRLAGREYHIYFHANGEREVVAMPKASAPRPAASPTGGTVAPF